MNRGKAQYRRFPTRVTPPIPPEYEQEFIRGGHRRVERLYGARTDLHVKWQEMLGGIRALQEKRRAYLKDVAMNNQPRKPHAV